MDEFLKIHWTSLWRVQWNFKNESNDIPCCASTNNIFLLSHDTKIGTNCLKLVQIFLFPMSFPARFCGFCGFNARGSHTWTMHFCQYPDEFRNTSSIQRFTERLRSLYWTGYKLKSVIKLAIGFLLLFLPPVISKMVIQNIESNCLICIMYRNVSF